MNNSQVNNSHGMITRGKKRNNENIDIISSSSSDEEEEIDSDGNLRDFIVNDISSKNKHKSQKALNHFRNQLNDYKLELPRKKHKKYKSEKDDKINSMFMTYLIMKATENANIELKKSNKKHKRRNKKHIHGTKDRKINADKESDEESDISICDSISSTNSYTRHKITVEEIDDFIEKANEKQKDIQKKSIEEIDEEIDGEIIEEMSETDYLHPHHIIHSKKN